MSKAGKAVKFKSNSLFLLLLVIAIIVFLCPEVGILRSEQACFAVIPGEAVGGVIAAPGLKRCASAAQWRDISGRHFLLLVSIILPCALLPGVSACISGFMSLLNGRYSGLF